MEPQDILDNISTGIVALDADLAVTAINSAGEALLQLSEARSRGMRAGQLLADPDEWLGCLEQARDEITPIVRRGMHLQLHSNQVIQVDLIITPIMGDPALQGLLLELQPVDRLLRISREESLQHAQETTRAVIRGLAHEIKNPLGGVRGAAQLLARELPDDALVEYTGIIIREADRLRDLVDRLLGPDRQPSMERVNIHEILEHVRNLVCVEADQQQIVDRDYDPCLPAKPADRARM